MTGGGAGADGAAAVGVGVGIDVVGALLDEMAVVSDCGCCHGRHSTPIPPSSSNTAATETPISHRGTELAESLGAAAPSVSDGDGVTWALRAVGAGVVGAAATRKVCGAAVSVKARAKSVQHANRADGQEFGRNLTGTGQSKLGGSTKVPPNPLPCQAKSERAMSRSRGKAMVNWSYRASTSKMLRPILFTARRWLPTRRHPSPC